MLVLSTWVEMVYVGQPLSTPLLIRVILASTQVEGLFFQTRNAMVHINQTMNVNIEEQGKEEMRDQKGLRPSPVQVFFNTFLSSQINQRKTD